MGGILDGFHHHINQFWSMFLPVFFQFDSLLSDGVAGRADDDIWVNVATLQGTWSSNAAVVFTFDPDIRHKKC